MSIIKQSIIGYSPFSIEDRADSYIIHGANHGMNTLKLSRQLIPARTQRYSASQRKEILSAYKGITSDNFLKIPFYTESPPFYNSLFNDLYQNCGVEGIEEVRNFIRKQMSNNFLVTLTRVVYIPLGERDEVIHNYWQEDEIKIGLDCLIGSNGHILRTENMEEPIQALLGIRQSLSKVNAVYRWLTREDTHLRRFDDVVYKRTETVARLGVGSDMVVLLCTGYPGESGPSLGMVVSKDLRRE